MQTPVEIDFHGLKANERLRTCVTKNITTLERRFGRITACRVVIKAPSERHRTGSACEVAIRLSLPQGRQVDIARSEKAEKAEERLADPVVAINAAFKRARRRLQDQARRMRGLVKSHDGPPVATVNALTPPPGSAFSRRRTAARSTSTRTASVMAALDSLRRVRASRFLRRWAPRDRRLAP
jgi:ribosome-associated translation inhibitor RaiA